MARIIFFAEKLPPAADAVSRFAFDLIRSLADHQHEIRVFSTYEPHIAPPPTPAHVEILRPFKKWSWLEVPAVVPLAMEFRPDILHFIQPRELALEGWTNATTALAGIGPLVGKPPVVTSFFDLHEDELPLHRLLLQASDAITVSNHTAASLLRRHFAKAKRTPHIEVIPAPSSLIHFSQGDQPYAADTGSPPAFARPAITDTAAEALEMFFSSHERVVFIPGDIDQQLDPPQVFDLASEILLNFEDTGIVFGGGWGRLRPRARRELMDVLESRGLGGRILITGPLESPLKSQLESDLLARADAVFVAALPRESLALTQFLRAALAVGAVLVISEAQSELDPLPWQDRTHAFISRGGTPGWGSALADALLARDLGASIRSRIREFHHREALDHPGNLMSRLYTRLIDSRPRAHGFR